MKIVLSNGVMLKRIVQTFIKCLNLLLKELDRQKEVRYLKDFKIQGKEIQQNIKSYTSASLERVTKPLSTNGGNMEKWWTFLQVAIPLKILKECTDDLSRR